MKNILKSIKKSKIKTQHSKREIDIDMDSFHYLMLNIFVYNNKQSDTSKSFKKNKNYGKYI